VLQCKECKLYSTLECYDWVLSKILRIEVKENGLDQYFTGMDCLYYSFIRYLGTVS